MNLHWPFFRKPEPLPHVIVRHVVATKRENVAAQQKATSIKLQLAVYKATTTPEQRAREASEAMSRLSRASMLGGRG